jgi:hypothetical protein
MRYCNVYSIKSILQAICTNHLYCYCLIIFLHMTPFMFGLNSDSYPKLELLHSFTWPWCLITIFLAFWQEKRLRAIYTGKVRGWGSMTERQWARTSAKHKHNFARINVSHVNWTWKYGTYLPALNKFSPPIAILVMAFDIFISWNYLWK